MKSKTTRDRETWDIANKTRQQPPETRPRQKKASRAQFVSLEWTNIQLDRNHFQQLYKQTD